MKKVILVGGFIEIIELCEESNIEIKGIFDKYSDKQINNYNILGDDNDAKELTEKFNKYPLVITPDLPVIRRKLKDIYHNYGYHFTSLISANSKISKSAIIEIGCIIQNSTNISAQVKIDEFVKINSMANIMHNSTIGKFTTIAPNAVILGFVDIGKNCYIGANATILPHIRIADDVIIGAGAVVTKSIEESGGVYTGVPARRTNKKQ